MSKLPRRKEYSFSRPVSIPDDFGPGSVASASGTVQLPPTVAWSGQGPYDLDDPQDRRQAYEIVLAEGRDPDANDSLDGVWEATRSGLPILRTGNVDSVVDAQLTRRIGLQSTLVSLARVAPTRALEILDTAWGEGTGIAVEVRDEDQIDIAAAISASVVVVNSGDALDNALRLAPDIAQLADRMVTAATVPPTADPRAHVAQLADAGYDAAVVKIDAGEDPSAVLGALADRHG